MKRPIILRILLVVVTIMTGCRKNDPPVIFDQVYLSYITHTTVVANVELKALNTAAFSLGVVYGEKPAPTVEDYSAEDFFGRPLSFSIGVSGMRPGTSYYMRPFIESDEGLFYGKDFLFETLQPVWFTDPRDNQKYLVRTYDNNTWMVENLNFRTPGSRYYANDSSAYAPEFGRLYTYNQACDACPPGWRLPSSHDWDNLIKFCGSTDEKSAEAMIEPGKRLWAESRTEIRTNARGFTIKPSGYLLLEEEERFSEPRYAACFWANSDNDNMVSAFLYAPHYSSHFVLRSDKNRLAFYSVRCLKDN
jgi:uncharacterized protein (TIGR02145 family)